MALNDNYKAVVTGTYLGQTCQNVFWYSQTSTGGGIAAITELANYIQANWCEDLAVYQSDLFEWTDITVTNWYTGTEAVSIDPAVVGTLTSEGLPAWFVYNISWNRSGAGYNYPSKRVSGVAESQIVDGDILGSTKTAIISLAAGMLGMTTTGGVVYSMRAFSPAPELGQNPYGSGFRFQAPTAVRTVGLGTQKTRK